MIKKILENIFAIKLTPKHFLFIVFGLRIRIKKSWLFVYERNDEDYFLKILFFKFKYRNYRKIYKKYYLTYEKNKELLDYIKNNVDIRDIKPLKGKVRRYQLADAKILKIVTSILEAHGFKYWLDSGTLLGAYRHKGFIPWDDDIDIAMLREDLIEAWPILKDELSKYGFLFNEGYGYKYVVCNRVIKSLWQIDIFPYDRFYKPIVSKQDQDMVLEKIKKAQDIFYNNYFPDYMSGKIKSLMNIENDIVKEIILDNKTPSPIEEYGGCGNTIITNYEFLPFRKRFVNYDDIFPLKRLPFEGYNLYVPNNTEKHLNFFYGNYLDYPNTLAAHRSIKDTFDEEFIEKNAKEIDEIFMEF